MATAEVNRDEERTNEMYVSDDDQAFIEAYAVQHEVEVDVALAMLISTARTRLEALARWSNKNKKAQKAAAKRTRKAK